MVVELSNRIPRRQPLDAPLLRHDALVARYDERSGVRGHGTPKRCIYPPIRRSGLRSAVFDTPRGGRHAFRRFILLSGRHRQASLQPPDTVDLPLTLVGITANSSFSHRSWSLSVWQCLVVLLCSARFTFSVCLSQASAFPWPAMSPALRYRGPNNVLLT
jgi:hypothetical protein